MGEQMEMKLVELGKLVSKMKIGDVIDFANSDRNCTEYYGGWCGVKRINEFSPDCPMFIVGHYGGDGEVMLYQLSEFDLRIGDFCEANYDPKDYSFCCSKMIADFILCYEGRVNDLLTVERYPDV